MRTTVTLDVDVNQLIHETMTRSRKSFKQVLNEAVRRGLKGNVEQMPAYVVNAKPMGLAAGIDPARIHEHDDELEVQEFLRKTRALEKTKK